MHYREFFHHFFEFCIKTSLYHPENWHCPNPVAALPTYLTKNGSITYLTENDVEAQLKVLTPYPSMFVAVAIMIYAGLRRSEVLWLNRDALAADLSFLSVVNRIDENDIENSLKTGERAVTILTPLRLILKEYLATLQVPWLVTSSKGTRWNGDAFGKKLHEINEEAGLKWNCLHFRHTYATQRAGEGWPLFRIAKEMGNSAAVVEQYYAAYVRPAALAHDSRA
jgi:integrase